MDRLTYTHFPDGTSTSNYYNDAGYPVAVRDRGDRWTYNSYDGVGHLTCVIYPNGDSVEKTYEGDLVTELKDGVDNITTYHYDQEQLVGVVFPDGRVIFC